MKRWMYLGLCMAVLAALTGCGSGNGTSEQTENQSVVTEDVPETEETDDTDVSDTKEVDDVDVDLTMLSSTMVYSEVYNMMVIPEDYIGKTVKMEGTFAYDYDESTDTYYFACIVQDATACCSQGIEFVLTDDYSYPEDYPEAGGSITVVGVFDTYQEGENTYCTLKNAELL